MEWICSYSEGSTGRFKSPDGKGNSHLIVLKTCAEGSLSKCVALLSDFQTSQPPLLNFPALTLPGARANLCPASTTSTT